MHLFRIYDDLGKYLKPGKALIIFGPRQVGKTTLVQNYLSHADGKYRFVTGDDIEMQTYLSVPSLSRLEEFASGYKLIVIDEAQKIPNIGQTLKLLVDQIS